MTQVYTQLPSAVVVAARQHDLQTVTDASSSEDVGAAIAPEHARQGSYAGGQISSLSQTPSRYFTHTELAASEEPGIITSYSSIHTIGAEVMPAANLSTRSGTGSAGYPSRDHCCQAANAGVALMDSSYVTDMHPGNDLSY